MPLRSGSQPTAAAAAEDDPDIVHKTKKQRASKLEAAKAKQNKMAVKLKALEVRTGPLKHALEVAKSAKRAERDAALQNHLGQVEAQKILVKDAAAAVAVQEKADGAKALQVLKAGAAAERRTAMSVKAIRQLTQCRLEMQKFMDDKSNKNTSIWDKIAATYNALVDAGVLEESDRRTADSLKAKFSTLDGLFKQHCRHIQRRKESGAPAEDVGAQPT
jgi:hypothetical protein